VRKSLDDQHPPQTVSNKKTSINMKKSKKKIKVRDIKPKKDAKGGGQTSTPLGPQGSTGGLTGGLGPPQLGPTN
jgi:hypothetical protein